MNYQLKNKSRFLSLVLRHKPEQLNLNMDKNGWVAVDELLTKAQLTKEELLEIVETNDKKRFVIEGDKIRASQGHSIDVDLKLNMEVPPFILYHGTGLKNKELLLKEGIKKMNRHHVHLTDNLDTAHKVGIRHGKPVIFEVRAREMNSAGLKFYKSENGVWLTDYIDPKYIVLHI